MRIIKESDAVKLPVERSQRIFIELWYGMVHRNSLDSHRVRCMNSMNILRELFDLLSKTLPKIEEDVKRVAQEALKIIGDDKVINDHFTKTWMRLKPLIEALNGKDGSKNNALIRYFLRDFLKELGESYKKAVLFELRKAIFDTKNEEDVFKCTGTLLSLLIDEGHSIEELFAIVQNVFISNRSAVPRTFQENFEFFCQMVEREKSEYEIIFRLEGGKKPDLIPEQIAGIRFERTPSLADSTGRVRSFLSPGQNVLFARIKVVSQDDRSAGLVAKDNLEEILDLIRFELEQEVVSIDQEFISIRTDKNTSRVFKLPGHIPNPQKNVDKDSFQLFIRTVGDTFQNDPAARESRERLKSAFRFYRMGRDSQEFENKFLNWWTGLEYLVRVGERGSIIGEIEKRFLPLMVLNYTRKHLESYRNTLAYCKIEIPQKTLEKFGASDLRELGLADLFSLIHNSTDYDEIVKQLGSFPSVHLHLERFKEQTKTPKSISDFLSQHEERLQWHINRIYRIRCDIVHSAEYTVNLTLLCANLEYYLKSILSTILEQLSRNKSIISLNEVFDRIEHACSSVKNDLKRGNSDFHDFMLREGIV